MTVIIPPEIEQELAARAEREQTNVETVVHQALAWYLQTDPNINGNKVGLLINFNVPKLRDGLKRMVN